MRKYKGYADYKDSGVEWIEEVPRYWSMVPVKRRFDVQLGKMLQNHPESEADVSTPYIKALYVLWGKVDTSGLPEMWASPADIRQYGVKKGDLLVCEGGEAGRAGIIVSVPSLCIIQNAVHRVRGNGADVRFLLYELHTVSSGGWFDVLCNKATIAHFTRKKLAELQVPLPATIDEQQAIAAFLDHKTSEIDALITNKEKLIELLKEQRQTIITEAVTKGLNPDAKMKDSGVEWIGEIPEHWMTIRLKYKAQLIIRKATESESELIYIGLENIEPKTGRLIGDMEQIIDGDALLFERSQVLFNKLRPYLSKCFLATCNGRCSSELFVLNAKSILPKFLYYTMLADLFIQTVNSSTYGVKMPRANWTFVGDVRITVPSSSEQQTIAAFLDHKTSEIDALITKERTQIEKLKSYRQSLIFEAVTGKIDVRDWSDKPLERSEAVANA